MKHTSISSAWRPIRTYRRRPGVHGVLSAFAFNLCLLILPLAAASAIVTIANDGLYAYEYSDTRAEQIRDRVARLNGDLIQVDFDRHNQWDGLVAMELMAGDPVAARGILLSGGGMLPARSANVLNRAADATDAELEVAAMQLLTPGTRERYEAMVPLLSLRGRNQTAEPAPSLADQQDFELMARALLAEPETDPLQFILTGYSLGLAGELSPRMSLGAVALLAASRRDDVADPLKAEIAALFRASMSMELFQEAAAAGGWRDPGLYQNSSAAFEFALDASQVSSAREVLDEVGGIAEATSLPAAVLMLTHAATLSDLPRLRLVAQSARDRAAAAAKRLPRDGRLVDAASGELQMNRELLLSLVASALAALGLIGLAAFKIYQGARALLRRLRDEDDYNSELIDLSSGLGAAPAGAAKLSVSGAASTWRPL